MKVSNTIILTVHNKEKTIKKILKYLFKSLSPLTKNLIIVIDGCTDNTSKKINQAIKELNFKKQIEIEIIYTDDIWETKANNKGLRLVKTEFATIVQDDMLIKHKHWDEGLINVYRNYRVFAVSGRSAHDFNFEKGNLIIKNVFGREAPLGDKNIFAKLISKFLIYTGSFWIYEMISPIGFRMSVNRGPLLFKVKHLKELNFFDEEFAPFELDDIDLCCRAFKKFGLLSACKPINFKMLGRSKSISSLSQKVSFNSIKKNTKILISRHSDLIA